MLIQVTPGFGGFLVSTFLIDVLESPGGHAIEIGGVFIEDMI